MANTTLPGVFLKGVAGSRPAANAVAAGTVYSATDTGVITQSDGVSTWTTWATISTGMTNPMSAVGDIIQGTTAGAPAALAAPLAGKVLTGAGTTTPLVYAFPPGHEWDYAQATAGVTVSGTTEAAATTLVTGNAVTYDGALVMLEFFAPYTDAGTAILRFWLYDGTSSVGTQLGLINHNTDRTPPYFRYRFTPSGGSHTYGVRASVASGTCLIDAGNGASSAVVPMFMRLVKV